MDPVNVRVKFEVRSFTRSWNNVGYSKKHFAVDLWLRPRSLSPKFLMVFCSDGPCDVPAKFEVRSFTRSWDIKGELKKFGQSLDTPSLPFLQNF